MDIGTLAEHMTGRELHWKARGTDFFVRIEESKDHGKLHIAERAIPFHVIELNHHRGRVMMDGRTFDFYIHRQRNVHTVWFRGRTYQLERVDRGLLPDGQPSASSAVIALMPGRILRVEVSAGDLVSEKQPLIIMESMKMESTLGAPKSGRVEQVRCDVGQIVEAGEILMTVE
jgi:3-methylcrotonyl-CoA carboxylase alpha subunit